MKKITNVAVLGAVAALVADTSTPIMEGFSNAEVLDKLSAMADAFQKKNGHRKPSAATLENENLRNQIIDLLSDGVMRNNADIKTALGLPEDTTPQKISGIMRPALLDGTIAAKTVKGKKFYFLAHAEGVEEA